MPSQALATARALRKEERGEDAAALVAAAARRGELDAAELEQAGRFLRSLVDKALVPAPKLRVHVLGQCTTSWLTGVLGAVCWGRRQPAVVTDGGYDQVFQDLLALGRGEADVVVLLPWTQRLLGDASRSPEERVDDELALWRQCWAHAAGLGLKIVQIGYDATGPGPLGSMLAGSPGGALGLVRAANAALRAALPAGAFFVDLEEVAGAMGRDRFYDARRWYWTKQPFSEEGVVALSEAVQAGLRAVTTGPKKVLVLDCDNTLWGGVVGETGPLGIQLGDSPDGEAFRAFQAYCKALSQRGVVLAVATKNEVDDARSPFLENPHMQLRMADLAAFEAHWQPKSLSLQRIAEQLNLGLDSFVFFDDNPAEREQIRQALPEVEVVEVPADPVGYVRALEAGRWFDTAALTDEDAQRSGQYQAERARRELQASFQDLDAYLASLDMVADVRAVDEADLPRVVQLLAKTNQWNLTTRRHGAAVVAEMVADPRAVTMTLRLRDKFGDHGLVAVLLGVPEGDDLRIDTWLMSCRVIARTAEEYVFCELVDRARARGFRGLVGEYLPTKKNRQVAELYPRLGFGEAGALPDGGARYRVALDDVRLPTTWIRSA